jgi:predicted cupin superfamily sugar epimerase
MKPIDLIAHPEGGRFREVFRSANVVHTKDGAVRSALTHIYFSLQPGEVSRFHRVASDEIWNLYQGSGLDLYLWDGSSKPPRHVRLSAGNNRFCHVVPADMWQAAAPAGDAVLVGCSVAPGFEFSDFQLMDSNSRDARRLIAAAPEMAGLIHGAVGAYASPTTDGS